MRRICHTYRYCSLTLFWKACRDTYVSLVLVTVLLGEPVTKTISTCIERLSSNCNPNPSGLLTGFWGCGRRSGLCRWRRRSYSGLQYICQLDQKTNLTKKKKGTNESAWTADEQITTLAICSHLHTIEHSTSSKEFKFNSVYAALKAKGAWLFLRYKYR